MLSEGCGLAVDSLGLLVDRVWFLGREGRGGIGLGGGGRGSEGDTFPLSDDDDDEVSILLEGAWFSERGGRWRRGGATGEG